MKIPRPLLVRLSPLVEAARGAPLIEPFVVVTGNDDSRLTVRSSYGDFEFDKVRRVVIKDGIEISSFEAVQSVDVGTFPGGLGERSWSIVLFRGLVDRITIGRTYDDGEASVVASRLASTLGCKVVAL